VKTAEEEHEDQDEVGGELTVGRTVALHDILEPPK
jgi:hypothetical protein